MKNLIPLLLLLCIGCATPEQQDTAPAPVVMRGGEEPDCHHCACEVNQWYQKYLLYEVQALMNTSAPGNDQLVQILALLENAKVYAFGEVDEHGCEPFTQLSADPYPAPNPCDTVPE